MTCLQNKTLYSLPGGNSRYPGGASESPPHILSNQGGAVMVSIIVLILIKKETFKIA